MNTKILLVLIAVMGVGLYALPSTVALFSGQHTFTNIDPTGNQIECTKCHGDVQAEIGASMSAVTGTPGAHAAFKCEFCHRIEAGSSSGDNAIGQVMYENADGSIVRLVAVNVMDMEAGNIPVSITTTMTNVTARLQPTESGNPLTRGAISLSPCAPAGCELVETVLDVVPIPDRRIIPTYAAGIPKDTNDATKNTGLNVNLITWIWDAAGRGVNRNVPVFTGAGSRTVNPGSSYHAASLVSCLECHGGNEPMGHYSRVVDGEDATNQCVKCHYGSSGDTRMRNLWAGGFGLTTRPGDTGATEAHNEFVKTTDGGVTRFGYDASNGACVACHTHVAVDITYTKPDTYQFNAQFGTDGTETVDGFAATGAVVSSSGGIP